MKELTFEESADWAMGEFFTESGNYSDLVHIVECGQGFEDIGLEPIEEFEHDTPETMLKKVNQLAESTQQLSTHGVHNIQEPMSQNDLIELVTKTMALWVQEEIELNPESTESFEDRACNTIDSFIEELQVKAYKIKKAA